MILKGCGGVRITKEYIAVEGVEWWGVEGGVRKIGWLRQTWLFLRGGGCVGRAEQ